LLSQLLLTDRYVFGFEVALAELSARLVTLSACGTASGPASIGGRTDTMASVFLRAGAREVAASLWPLDDEVAELFIKRFYRQIVDSDLSAAESLREAQRWIRVIPKFNHLYYWALFVVYRT
jgi:CHAT domain-containing protein